MGRFRRTARSAIFGPEPVSQLDVEPIDPEVDGIEAEAEPEPEPADLAPPEPEGGIKVARTLVKSEPELAELVAAEPRLGADGIDVTLVEKGFGIRVEIRASEDSGVGLNELEGLLDSLAEPQKRPFSAS